MARTRTVIEDGATIAEVAREILTETHPDWSDETLLFHPLKARALCNAVRADMGRRGLDDDVILRALVNQRKRGRVGNSKAKK